MKEKKNIFLNVYFQCVQLLGRAILGTLPRLLASALIILGAFAITLLAEILIAINLFRVFLLLRVSFTCISQNFTV